MLDDEGNCRDSNGGNQDFFLNTKNFVNESGNFHPSVAVHSLHLIMNRLMFHAQKKVTRIISFILNYFAAKKKTANYSFSPPFGLSV